MFPGVGTSTGSSGGGREDAPEECSGDCRPARSGLLQPPFPGGEGGWRPVIDLSALNGFMMLTKFRMETVASVLGLSEEGMGVLDRLQGRLLPDSHPSGLSPVPSVLSWESCLSVPCHVLLPVHSSTGVYQDLHSDFRVGALEGCVPPLLSGRLAGCGGVVAPSSVASGSNSPVPLSTGRSLTSTRSFVFSIWAC